MANSDGTAGVELLVQQSSTLVDTAKTAIRNKVSLAGSNFYGDKFHSQLVELAKTEARVTQALGACQLDSAHTVEFSGCLSTIKTTSPAVSPRQRDAALRQLKLLSHSIIMPALGRVEIEAIPQTEDVLPVSVVQNTRGYLEKVILQANGCYERHWFDATSVMIRKFVEILIIEVYEAAQRASDIQDVHGNFRMLGDLIDTILGDAAFNLARETKKTLPLIKQQGDRAAHNRRFLATRQDVDRIVPGLRVAADDLLHLANLK